MSYTTTMTTNEEKRPTIFVRSHRHLHDEFSLAPQTNANTKSDGSYPCWCDFSRWTGERRKTIVDLMEGIIRRQQHNQVIMKTKRPRTANISRAPSDREHREERGDKKNSRSPKSKRQMKITSLSTQNIPLEFYITAIHECQQLKMFGRVD